MRLGIYGGTFSPVHNAHVRAAKSFLEECELDKLIIIPAGIPPHKAISADDDPSKRLDMCRIAFSSLPKTEISDMELKRSGKSYTVMTIRALAEEGSEIFLLCGTDMILTFDSWYCFEEIMDKCTLVYVRREDDGDISVELERKIAFYEEKYHARVRKLTVDALEMSSTDIRAAIANDEDISDRVPLGIYEYIRNNHLYK